MRREVFSGTVVNEMAIRCTADIYRVLKSKLPPPQIKNGAFILRNIPGGFAADHCSL